MKPIKIYTGIRIKKKLGDSLVEYNIKTKNGDIVKILARNSQVIKELEKKGVLKKSKKSWDENGVYFFSNRDAYRHLDIMEKIAISIIR